MTRNLLASFRVAAGRPILRGLSAATPVRAWIARGRATPVEGQIVDEPLRVVLAFDDLLHDGNPVGRTPVDARARMLDSIPLVDADPPPGVVSRDETLAGHIPGRLYVPPALETPAPAIVFFHGGGWVTGDLDTHDAFCRRLAVRAGARVIAVHYRLAPESRFPAAVDDALAAFRFVVESAARLGLDPKRIGVAGDSAGGNLAAVVARRTRGDANRPAVAALIYPGLDATMASPSHATFGERYLLTHASIEWYLGHYLGDVAALARQPDVSPLLAADPEGLCPHLITVAHFDPLRDEGEAYAGKLAAAGTKVKLVRCPTLIHGFIVMGGLSPAALAATDALATDIGAALRGSLSLG